MRAMDSISLRMLLRLTAVLAVLAALFVWENMSTPHRPPVPSGAIQRSCEPVLKCQQMLSCEDAAWHLHNCSWGKTLDGDGNGIACETICRIQS